MGALDGIRVLDLSRYAPGRYCTVTLADFGAEVITIEVPRTSGAEWQFLADDTSPRYLALNRNKKSITLNLRVAPGKRAFYRLAETADVILEGFRPGVTKRLGVDYDTIRNMNPRIIYAAISGFGQSGPYVDRPGHDLNYVGIAGILDMTGPRGGPPVPIGVEVADLGAGSSQAVTGILLALLARERTGRGQYIDISMLDGLISWQWVRAIQYFRDGTVTHRGETVGTGSEPGFNIYPASDGAYITIGATEPAFWESLCRTLGREDLLQHQHATGEMRDRIFADFARIFRGKSSAEWLAVLAKADVPCGPVNSIDQALADPQVQHRGMVAGVKHATLGNIKQLGVPIKLSDTPGEIRTPPPAYGADTDSILAGIGYSEQQVRELRQAKVIE